MQNKTLAKENITPKKTTDRGLAELSSASAASRMTAVLASLGPVGEKKRRQGGRTSDVRPVA